MTVYLVGAGPGDPGLLTVRGAQVLSKADVVIYDRLSVASLLELAPTQAERISVGKAPGRATMSQEAINALLVERGKTGQEVVRLKGGDPFVFARGGEEAQALIEAGVPFEVIPGITSAIAVPAYAGIPVTMRHSSELFTVITGHEDPDKGGELDWEAVARLGGTIVILMGVGRLPKIVDRLRSGGLSADTPVVAVQWGTRPEQRTVRATLGTILHHDLEPPSTIVVGRVAALNLAWYESKPLFGKRVVVTRARRQASALADRLRIAGADPVEVPVIEIVDPPDGGAALRTAAQSLARGKFSWLVVTSENGAQRILAALHDARDLGNVKVAAIGPGTAAALHAGNIKADLIPDRFVAEAFVEAFPPPAHTGERVLIARATVARDVLPEGLRSKGYDVEVVEAYQTVAVSFDEEAAARLRSADAVTFTSSSTVERFVESFGAEALPPVVACIGPVTAATARSFGITVDVEAEVHTIDGLVEALVQHFRQSTPRTRTS
ncbi:MAG: uroporphyrinogen-III C-methyltransferase [Acidimicrobiales bacterium]|nr:uroporphyrinogen-III C-methyltransferase [Acidimicrobiales bacterium]